MSLRNLCVLCASAVKEQVNRRGAEDAEITQRTHPLTARRGLTIFWTVLYSSRSRFIR